MKTFVAVTMVMLIALAFCGCSGVKVAFTIAEVSEIDERQVLTDRKSPESIVKKVSKDSQRY